LVNEGESVTLQPESILIYTSPDAA
jgi:hypothetical protein